MLPVPGRRGVVELSFGIWRTDEAICVLYVGAASDRSIEVRTGRRRPRLRSSLTAAARFWIRLANRKSSMAFSSSGGSMTCKPSVRSLSDIITVYRGLLPPRLAPALRKRDRPCRGYRGSADCCDRVAALRRRAFRSRSDTGARWRAILSAARFRGWVCGVSI